MVNRCAEYSQKTPNKAIAFSVDPVVFRAPGKAARPAVRTLNVILEQNPPPVPDGVTATAHDLRPVGNPFDEGAGTSLS